MQSRLPVQFSLIKSFCRTPRRPLRPLLLAALCCLCTLSFFPPLQRLSSPAHASPDTSVESLQQELDSLVETFKWKDARKVAKKLRKELDGAEREAIDHLLERLDAELALDKIVNKPAKLPQKRLMKLRAFVAKHWRHPLAVARARTHLEDIRKRIYVLLEDFEDFKDMDPDLVQVKDAKLVKHGSSSARFKVASNGTMSIYIPVESPDLTGYEALVFWAYSEKAEGRLTIDAMSSDNSYFEAWNNVTWTGWKEVRIPLAGKKSTFAATEGRPHWAEIESFRFWKDDGPPIDIVIDDVRLEKKVKK